MGNLYIVATPIGNLQDITARAIETLRIVDVILCEDSRKTGILLNELTKRYNVTLPKKNFLSYFEQNEKKRIPEVLNLLKQGIDVALVCDAGTPTISDPGFKLVRECLMRGLKVISVPGPCSVISALISSGLPTDKFTFLGYLPQKTTQRLKIFEKIKTANDVLKSTFVIFVAPHDLLKILQEMLVFFGDREVVIARELTKIYEEVEIDQITKLVSYFAKKKVKGELVLLFNLN